MLPLNSSLRAVLLCSTAVDPFFETTPDDHLGLK